MKKDKVETESYVGPDRRGGWHRTATLRDVIIFEIMGVILTIVLVFTIAGLASQGQKVLAERVDRNADLSATGTNGVRCFLHRLYVSPNSPVTDVEIRKCFEAYDDAFFNYYNELPEEGGEF